MPDLLPIPSGQNYFLFDKTINASGTVTALLSTENKFLDKNIGIKITTPAGVANTGSATATLSVSNTDGTNAGVNVHGILSTASNPAVEPSSGYYVAITATPSGFSHVDQAGWFSTGDLPTINGSAITNYFTIQEAMVTVTKTSGSITPSASLDKSSTLTWSDSNTSGISVTAHGNGSAEFVAQANVTTPGYLPQQNNLFNSGTLTISAAANDATAIKYLTEVVIGSGKSFQATINQGTLNVISDNKTTGTVNVSAYKSSTDTATRVSRQIIKNGVWNTQTVAAANTEYYGLVKADATTIITSADTGYLGNYFTSGTSSDNDVTIIPKYTATAGFTSAVATATTTAGTTYWKIKTASPTFKAEPTGGSTADFTNVTYSETNNGIKIQTKYSINSVAIKYAANMDGGWLSDKTANQTTGSSTTSKASTNGSYYYITGVTVPSGATFLTTAASNSAGTIQVKAYASDTDTTTNLTAQTVVTNGVWETLTYKPTSSVQGPHYGKTSVAAVTQSQLTAGNIKYGTTITIKGGDSNIWSVPGTFTSASTVSSGQTAVSYDNNNYSSEILTGYSAWVDGKEIKGNVQTIQVTYGEWSKNDSNVVTTNTASWGSGIIASGSIPVVTFGNSATAGTTYLDISDGVTANNEDIVPEVLAGGKLYINHGYIDDVCIDLAKLIPDDSAVSGLIGDYILTGHSAYDNAGNLILGIMPKLEAHTYTPTTTDQTIAVGQYINGVQTIKGDSDLTAGNIKKGVTIFGVTGTYTTITGTGKQALTAASLRSGYAGYANGGSQINGTMPDVTVTASIVASSNLTSKYFTSGTSSNYDVSLTPRYTNDAVGYLGVTAGNHDGTVAYYKIKVASFTNNGGNVALETDANSINSIASVQSAVPSDSTTKVYLKVTGSGYIKTTASGGGWWENDTDTGATGSATKYIHLDRYTGAYQYVSSLSS